MNEEEISRRIEEAVKGIEEKVAKAVAGIEKEVGNIEIEKVETGKVTKNLGILNLKDATGEDIENMNNIKNLGIIIVPEKYLGKVSNKVVANLGMIVPYVEGMRLYTGSTTIDASMLQALDEPIEFIQTGSLSFEKDITEQLVKDKIKEFRNYGAVEVPGSIYGAVMAKCMENCGAISKSGDDED